MGIQERKIEADVVLHAKKNSNPMPSLTLTMESASPMYQVDIALWSRKISTGAMVSQFISLLVVFCILSCLIIHRVQRLKLKDQYHLTLIP